MAQILSEDKVRNQAKEILNFYDSPEAQSDTGQITTFNKLLNIPISKKETKVIKL